MNNRSYLSGQIIPESIKLNYILRSQGDYPIREFIAGVVACVQRWFEPLKNFIV